MSVSIHSENLAVPFADISVVEMRSIISLPAVSLVRSKWRIVRLTMSSVSVTMYLLWLNANFTSNTRQVQIFRVHTAHNH